jgi:hypothetical protein
MSDIDEAHKRLTAPQTVTLLQLIDIILLAAGLGAGLTLAANIVGFVILAAAAVRLLLKVYDRLKES